MQGPDHDAINVASALEKTGFDLQLLSSVSYVSQKLCSLKPAGIRKLKATFRRNLHPRYRKDLLGSGRIFGSKEELDGIVRKLGNAKLAQLIRITGQLLQTKVYLFWERETREN